MSDEEGRAIYEAFAGPVREDEAKATLRWSQWPWNRCQSVTRVYGVYVRCDLVRQHRTPECVAERGMETLKWTSAHIWTDNQDEARPIGGCNMNTAVALLLMGVGSAAFLMLAYGLVAFLHWVLS